MSKGAWIALINSMVLLVSAIWHKSSIDNVQLYRSSPLIQVEVFSLIIAWIFLIGSLITLIKFPFKRDAQGLAGALIILVVSLVAIITASVVDMETLVYAT